jgi:putative intracellular protease/amidase
VRQHPSSFPAAGQLSRREALLLGAVSAGSTLLSHSSRASETTPAATATKGGTPVAIVLSEGATVIDFAGPWEVFQDASGGEGHADPNGYELFTVAATRTPITATAGLQIVPNFTFAEAPQPAILVVGAQKGGPAVLEYLKWVHSRAQLTMSVCTGAFQLARAGLLDGLSATTHHEFYDKFAAEFPRVKLVRDTRYVDHGAIATAGGLTSGLDLAVFARYPRAGTSGSRSQNIMDRSRLCMPAPLLIGAARNCGHRDTQTSNFCNAHPHRIADKLHGYALEGRAVILSELPATRAATRPGTMNAAGFQPLPGDDLAAVRRMAATRRARTFSTK